MRTGWKAGAAAFWLFVVACVEGEGVHGCMKITHTKGKAANLLLHGLCRPWLSCAAAVAVAVPCM